MPPSKTGKTITGKTRRTFALSAADEKAKADCEKRGGTWIDATETQAAVCLLVPKKPSFVIQIDRYRGDPCQGPVGPRDPYILVPPTKELAQALINAIKR